MKISSLVLLNVFFVVSALAQPTFQYKREVTPVSPDGEWQRIDLPAELFNHIREDFSDIRLYQIDKKDTIEAPYLLKVLHETVTESIYNLPALNQSKKDGKLYLTFEMPAGKKINVLELGLQEDNYNAYVTIEGSNDKKEWFLLAERERILDIQTPTTQFESNSISFPITDYAFLRLSIQCDKPLTFNSATFKEQVSTPGELKELAHAYKRSEQGRSKQTEWMVTLPHKQPVSAVTLQINNTGDYYRPVSIEALTDSLSTEKGWIYNYRILTTGYVTSLRENTFSFTPTLAQRIRVVVSNFDSPALAVENISLSGPVVALFLPYSGNQKLEMFYGSATTYAPQYDLVHFQNNIPDSVPLMQLGAEVFIGEPINRTAPLFENPMWLWAVMVLVIGVLGFFTFKMMKAKA
ncbi:MAG: DUF3999 family protein [Bacteroidota bacterium]